jgi:hypothetical protein
MKNYSDETMEQVYANLEGTKNEKGNFCLTLGQSVSSKDVRFVLYRQDINRRWSFVRILSDDLLKSSELARKHCQGYFIFLEEDRNNLRRKDNTIPFGKYVGQFPEDIAVTDAKYLLWLADAYNGKNNYLKAELIALKNQLRETISNENKEKFSVEKLGAGFVGTIGEYSTFEVTVTEIKPIEDSEVGALIISFIDKDNNRIKKYGNLMGVEVGQRYSFESVVKRHNEYLGFKTTMLGGRLRKVKLL